MNQEEVKEEVRSRNDIADVVGQYVRLQQAGGVHKGLCPFHKEKTPSFNVDPRRQAFHCFGCGEGGDVFAFIMRIEGVDFPTALQMLGKRVGMDVEPQRGSGDQGPNKQQLFDVLDGATTFFQDCLTVDSEEARIALAYLEDRRLTAEVRKRWRIGFAPDSWDGVINWAQSKRFDTKLLDTVGLVTSKEGSRSFYDRFRGRIMFPLFDEVGRVIGFSGRVLDSDQPGGKYINTPETRLFKKSKVLFGLNQARKHIVDQQQAILCEGQIDVIQCQEAGITNAVAALGTAVTEDHARVLARYAERILLLLDADQAGMKAALKAAEMLLAADLGVSAVPLPEGDDPDSLIAREGSEAFLHRLEKDAEPILEFQLRFLRKVLNLADDVGMKKAVRQVLHLIARVPSPVRRQHFLTQAAELLGVSEALLHDESRAVLAGQKRGAPEAPEPPPEPRKWERKSKSGNKRPWKGKQSLEEQLLDAPSLPQRDPREEEEAIPSFEIRLLELLLAYPELRPIAAQYIEAIHATSPPIRTCLEVLLTEPSTRDSDARLLGKLPESADIAKKLMTERMFSATPIIGSDLDSPEQALQGVIRRIRLAHLGDLQKGLQVRIASATGASREDIELEHLRVGMIIGHLRDVKRQWDDIAPLLRLH